MWAFAFQADQTADGRSVWLCNIVDEFTREALVMLVKRSIDADTVVSELERLVAWRGAPAHLRMDNGPEMTAHALRDYCRFSGTATRYIDPGAPWQNPFVESFHSRVRDELLGVEEFACLTEAQVVIEDWREDYYARRSHSALGMRAAAVFAAQWTAATPGAGRVRRGYLATRAATIATAPLATLAPSDDGRGSTSVVIRPPGALRSRPSHPPPSHSWWTDKRGPVRRRWPRRRTASPRPSAGPESGLDVSWLTCCGAQDP